MTTATYRTIDNRRWVKPAEVTGLPVGSREVALVAATAPNENLAEDLGVYEPEEDGGEVTFDLRPMAMVWGEFKLRHADHAETDLWLKQFKTLFPRFPGVTQKNTVLTMNGDTVATYRYDGVLSKKRVQENYPDLYQKFLKRKSTLVFDEEAFKEKYPLEYQLCRGRSLRLKKSAGGILLPN